MMDEVRIVRRRTHIWPVVIAIIILALVVIWALFSMNGARAVGWLPQPVIEAARALTA
jgi:hypothetical protein